MIQPKNQTEETQQDKSSSSSAAKMLDITTVVSSNSSNHDQDPARPSFTNAPLYPKNKRPVNLVSSWGGSSKSTVKPESSAAKYKQPLKKRRRLSTAVVKSLNSPGKHLYHHLVQLIFFVHISSRQQQQFQVGEVDTEETSPDGIHRRLQSIWWNTKEIRNQHR